MLTILLRIHQISIDLIEGFSSTHHGMMHACGHDGHIAIGLGVATVLNLYRDSLNIKICLKGTVGI